MKLKKMLSVLLALSLLASFACCFSADARSNIEIGKAYISFSDNGVRIDAGADYPTPVGTIFSQSEVTLYSGDTVADITQSFVEEIKLAKVNFGTKDSKLYLKELTDVITESGTELARFGDGSGGAGSCWMVKLNGRLCTESLEQIFVDTNNRIEWCFSCQDGKDIGADLSKPSAAIASLTITPGELSPAFSKDVKDYTVSLPANVSTVNVEAVAENAGAEISYALLTGDKRIEYKPHIPIPIKHFVLIVVASKYYDEQSGTVLTDTINIRILQDSPKPTNFFRALILGIIDFFRNLFSRFAG